MAQARPLATRLPWNDRAGRFSPVKATVLALVCVPALWIAWQALVIGLGPRPLTEAIHKVGDWTVYLLLTTLAVTPARRLFEWSKLIQVRRIVGLAALSYILVHFTLYVVDSRLDLIFVGNEIIHRVYLATGFTAILGLLALGVTSTDAMIKRLGAIRWNRLHKLIYFIVPLAILHYYMQSKVDVTQPVLMSGFFFWLMGYRLMARYGCKEGLVPLFLLAAGAALAAALVEGAWYGIATGIGAKRILLANLDFGFSIRPAWWVLAAGITVALAAEGRKRLAIARPAAKRPATARAIGRIDAHSESC